MKPTNLRHLIKNRTLLMVTTSLLICVLAACEGSNDLSESTSTRDTGSIAFNVTWNQPSDIETDYQTKAVVCGDEPDQVATVRAAIVNTETSVVKRGGPWDCTPPSGTIQGVPIGSDYTILFYGHNDGGRTTYSGVKLGISVNTGINDIGTIDANQFFSQITSPADESSNIDPDLARFEWEYALGAARYQLRISELEDIFSDPMPMTFDCDDLDFLVPAGNLDPNTTYYWTVFPYDIDNNMSWFYWAIFSFTTASATMDDNYEDNDTLGTAYDISGDEQTYLSSIDGLGVANSGDDDYYQIEVTSGYEYLTIDCFFTDDNGDIDIWLYTLDGTLVTSATSTTDNEHIEFDVTSYGSGTYYIRVYKPAYGSNTYDLWWDDTIGPDDNYEDNDSIATAQDLWEASPLSSIDGYGIALFNDDDYYRIDVPYTSANLVIGCTFIHSSGDIDTELYDAGGNRLQISTTTTDNEYIYHTHAGGPAIYYVKIRLFSDAVGISNTYDLTWTAQSAVP